MALQAQELAAQAAKISRAELGEKTRVHALAKQLGLSSNEMLSVLSTHGVADKRAASTVTKQQVETVLDALVGDSEKGSDSSSDAKKKAPRKTAKKAPAKKAASKKTTAKKTEPLAENAEPEVAVPEPAAEAASEPVAEAAAETAKGEAPKKRGTRKAASKTAAKVSAKKAPAKKAAAKKSAAKKTEATQDEKPADVAPVDAPAEEFVPVAEPGAADDVQDAPAQDVPAEDKSQDTADKVEQVEDKPAKPARRRGPRKVTRKLAPKAELKTAPKAENARIEDEDAETQDAADSAFSSDDTVDRVIAGLFKDSDDSSEPAESEPQEATKQDRAQPKRRVRKVRRVVRRGGVAADASTSEAPQATEEAATENQSGDEEKGDNQDNDSSSRGRGNRNRNRRRKVSRSGDNKPADNTPEDASAQDNSTAPVETTERSDDTEPTNLHPAERDESDIVDEPVRFKGSTRLESRRRWKAENRNESRHVVSRSEFLARRESVDRVMVVRDAQRTDHAGLTTQVGVVEDGLLVEHFVTSETQHSMVGNVYLGTVQNVLASMEAAFIDLGTGRNAVLYAGEMNWHSPHLRSKNRRIESALRPGDQIMVQVIKDPVGHKGARLTARISFAGRYLVYFPGGTTAGISRKLPESERKRLKGILERVIPGEGGAIIRTAAENASEESIGDDVNRLHTMWESVMEEENKARSGKGSTPVTLYEEPNMLIKVIRDIFNPDFSQLIVDGEKSWEMVRNYVSRMASDLKDRVVKWHPEQHGDKDVFAGMELDEQLSKALSRKVWLPSGGHLVIDHTEAMTVVDVNTGSFIGSGGNLEETVTQNNLEAAEEIVRQMRLRDLGGMIVVDFIDMVLEENQDLVLRRLTEFLGRDRTRHKVSEVTSLGLVQMTRKRLGIGLLETFSTECEHCGGRGVIVHADPVEHEEEEDTRPRRDHGNRKERQQAKREKQKREEHENKREERSDRSEREDKPSKSDKRDNKRRGQDRKNRPQKNDSDAADSAEKQSKQAERGGSTVGAGASATQRRRVRRVVRRHAPANQQASQASDAGDSRQESPRTKASEQKSGSSNGRTRSPKAASSADRVAAQRSESKRRVRRVVRSAADSSAANTANNAKTAKADAGKNAVKNTAPAKRDNSSKSFEQAQAEFDASPRRKRNTRGNSRSDVPPRAEDFGGSEQPAQAGTAHSKSAPSKRAADKPAAGKGNKQDGQELASNEKRGRRRRVVRRTT